MFKVRAAFSIRRQTKQLATAWSQKVAPQSTQDQKQPLFSKNNETANFLIVWLSAKFSVGAKKNWPDFCQQCLGLTLT